MSLFRYQLCCEIHLSNFSVDDDLGLNLPHGHEYTDYKVIQKGDCLTSTLNCDELESKCDITVSCVK